MFDLMKLHPLSKKRKTIMLMQILNSPKTDFTVKRHLKDKRFTQKLAIILENLHLATWKNVYQLDVYSKRLTIPSIINKFIVRSFLPLALCAK